MRDISRHCKNYLSFGNVAASEAPILIYRNIGVVPLTRIVI